MKLFLCAFALASVSALMAGCGAPAANTTVGNANTNVNSNANAKPAAAAPTADALLAMEKQANEAWIKGDKAFFEGFLSDKFVEYGDGKRMSKSELVGMIGSFKCDVKSWSVDDPQVSRIDADTYVVSAKGNYDGSCTGPDGKSMKIPSPTRTASVYIREGDKWKGIYHGESVIVAPSTAPASNTASNAKKEEPKKEVTKTDEKAASNANTASNSSAAPAADGNTDALATLHRSGWEAWRNKDAKKFEEMTTKDLSVLNPVGMWISGQANVITAWTGMKCEGVTKTSFTDAVATAVSPTLEILTGKGSSDGTCDGQKNGDLYQTAFYVKDGAAWKLAFMAESLPGM